MDDLVDLVRQSLADETYREFSARVDEQADQLREAIAAGRFDNDDFAVGLEVELYAVAKEPDPVPEPGADGDDDAVESDDAPSDPDADLSGGGGGQPTLELEDPDPPDEADESEVDEPEEGDAGRSEPYMDPEEWEGRLVRLPETVFDGAAAKELGLHNAEINTDPDPFDPTGVEVQRTAVEMAFKSARDAARAENADLVLDAMWTVPPEEGADPYLTARDERDGVVVAENMRQDPRYVALDNEALRHAGGDIAFDVPGVDRSFPTILFESLTTSIQPHLQIPNADRFPAYYNAGIRTLGPVLALTVNSPFLPPDLYTDVADPERLLEETHHELRIQAFEQSVNTSANPKVRVPADIEDVTDVVDGVVGDDCFAPFLREWLTDAPRDGLEEYWEFDHKRGTYWRWLRCVVGGDPVDGAGDRRSLRIEYRPVPTQPTVDDVVSVQFLVAGLLRGLVAADHPLSELPWQDAERSFYAAARDGLDAELAWVTAEGERTTDHETIYDELFTYARHGLAAADLSEDRIDELLAPLEARWAARETPSSWKIGRVREYLADGHDLERAIHEMQRDYYEASAAAEPFAEWL